MIATYATFVVHRSNNPAAAVFWCALLFVVGIVVFIRGFGLLKRRRLILDTPFSKIRSASIGMVEVTGQAIGPYTMTAPITRHPCYYYRTLVWEYKQQGKNKQWVKIAGECMHLPFFIDDNTGRVMVDPRGADLDLHRDFQQEFCNSIFTIKDPAPPNVNSFLSRHGIVTDNKIKVEEFCIKPKNALFVLGTLGENPGVEVTTRPMQEIEPLGPSTQAFSLFFSGALSTPSIGNDIDTAAFAERFSAPSQTGQSNFGQPNLGRPNPGGPNAGQSNSGPTRSAEFMQRQEVIRLSSDSAPVKTADMTQQQKVAAALLKAGISNPAAWVAGGLSTSALGGPGVIVDSSFNVPSENGGNGNSGINGPHTSGNGSNGSGTSVQQAASEGFVLRPPVVLRKGENNPTFLISWRSQQEVARTLGWKCTLMIWGGPAMSLLSLYLLLSVVHLI